MTREIKFRAWNIEKEIMCYDDEDGSEDFLDGIESSDIGFINSRLAVPSRDEPYAFRNNYEVMQFTGLLDKNGVEIYEGDIVTGGWKGEKFQIKFSDGVDIGSNGGEYTNWITGFVPTHADGSVDDCGNCEFMYTQMIYGGAEIIGNIHQHPHLLGDE